MQIVIDVPEEYYKAITEIPTHQCTADMLIIKNGTPLPKGHGRLIDADMLINKYAYDLDNNFIVDLKDINDAPTIIEADKAESEDSK